MLNTNKVLTSKVQELLDGSHKGIKAIWTDGETEVAMYIPHDFDYDGVNKVVNELDKIFPDLDDEDTTLLPTKRIEALKFHTEGYYVERN